MMHEMKSTVFCEESYNAFPTWLSFIIKLNSNQFNIKKIKSINNFEKKFYKKKNIKETGKKTMSTKTLAIHSVLWGKLQRFPHMI